MKLLLRATNWVGDVVMSLPALRALRAAHRGDRLSVLARPWVADLYRLRPEVDEVIVEEPKGAHRGLSGRARLAGELRERGFDRAITLPDSFDAAWTLYRAGIPERWGYRNEARSLFLTHPVRLRLAPGEHQVWKHLRLVAAAGAPLPALPDASWSVDKKLRESAGKRLREAGWDGEPFLAAHAASFAHAAKRWGLPRFAELFDLLALTRSLSVALLGSSSESEANREITGLARRARVLDLSGKTTLPEVLGLVSQAALFVGNDSGLAHLAAAAGTPCTVVFGPTDPEATRPWQGRPGRVRVVRQKTLCAPCRFRRCPIDHVCMEALTAERLLAGVEASLLDPSA